MFFRLKFYLEVYFRVRKFYGLVFFRLSFLPQVKEKLRSTSSGYDLTFLRVLRRTIGMLYGPHALEGFNEVIIFSISIAEVGDNRKLEIWGLSK